MSTVSQMSSSLTRCDLVDPPNNPFPASILQEAISINHRYHLSWLLQVVHQIISLNKSTLSYWWRGGRELNGWVNNEADLMNLSSCWILSIRYTGLRWNIFLMRLIQIIMVKCLLRSLSKAGMKLKLYPSEYKIDP